MSNAVDVGAGDSLIIGLGHRERQDDGVGPYVAQALRQRGLPAHAYEGEGTGLLDLWDGRDRCLVIDAVSGPGAPGSLHIFEDLDDPGFARAAFVHSTHRFGLPEAIALGRALGRLPKRLQVIGITGTAFGFGSGLSPEVAAAAARLIERLASTNGFAEEDIRSANSSGDQQP